MRKFSILFFIMVLVVVSGCGGAGTVGDEKLLDFESKPQERLGNIESPSPSPSPTGPAESPQPKQAIAPPSPAKQEPQSPPFKIAINSDNANAPAFDPPVGRVFQGTVVTWTNNDSVPRTVQADEGAFTSPSIGPGASWSYTASTPGKFNYHDGTRNYAVASLEVLAR